MDDTRGSRSEGKVGRAALALLGHDEVVEHVEGVAVGVHSQHLTTLLVDLQEARVVQADHGHQWALSATQADLLCTRRQKEGRSGERPAGRLGGPEHGIWGTGDMIRHRGYLGRNSGSCWGKEQSLWVSSGVPQFHSTICGRVTRGVSTFLKGFVCMCLSMRM